MEFRRKIGEFSKKHQLFREFVYIFLPFFDDNINASYTSFLFLLKIPFLRLLIYKLKFRKIGDNFKVKYPVYIKKGKNIKIGDGASFGTGTHLQAGRKSKINIGKNYVGSPRVFISASSLKTNRQKELKEQEYTEKDINIGDGVWIGINSVVLPGVTIEDGAIISANSLILANTHVGKFEIFGGVPAKKVGMRK